MRVTICWFGYELDFSLGPTTVDDYEPTCSLDGGTTASQVVGFCPSPRLAYEDTGSLHQWDPDETDEDREGT